MSGVKFFLLISVAVFAFVYEVNTIPSSTKELRFDSESNKNTDDDCMDMADCDPFGWSMCNNSRADTKWAIACCRHYCHFCNRTVPTKRYDCQGTPPMFY